MYKIGSKFFYQPAVPIRSAWVAEQVDARDLKSLGVYPCTSSILVPGTNKNRKLKVIKIGLLNRLFCSFQNLSSGYPAVSATGELPRRKNGHRFYRASVAVIAPDLIRDLGMDTCGLSRFQLHFFCLCLDADPDQHVSGQNRTPIKTFTIFRPEPPSLLPNQLLWYPPNYPDNRFTRCSETGGRSWIAKSRAR
jgi:hypothetical protein